MPKSSKTANVDSDMVCNKTAPTGTDPYLVFGKLVDDGADAGAGAGEPSTASTASTAAPAAPDPFDPERFRIDPSQGAIGVRKLLISVPVHKPKRHDFVRVHPGEEYRRTFALIEFDREYYLLTREIARDLPGEFRYCTVFTAITRAETLFLWPVKLPDPDGRENEWHRTMGEAALLAQTKWVRVRANMALGAYDVSEAETVLSEPVWPEHPFRELLKIGFKGRMVEDFDHLLIKKLRGLV
jgi:hypothetical protein